MACGERMPLQVPRRLFARVRTCPSALTSRHPGQHRAPERVPDSGALRMLLAVFVCNWSTSSTLPSWSDGSAMSRMTMGLLWLWSHVAGS